MKLALSILALAALAAGLSPAFAQSDAGPRGTLQAVRCLVRQGPPGCEEMFVGRASQAARPLVFENAKRDFNRGPLLASDFWGRASETNAFDARILIGQPTREMDIYDVKFAHFEYSYYIGPPNEDGKINALAIRLYAPHDPLQVQHR